jgi:aspartyl-tRNA(Asn)/glutamyl-tRNA(Gln) amidotransferase subunit B
MSDAYETVVGLEVHVQLKTKSKMFCGCENRYGAEPNTLTCPVCTGQPGALPVANIEAFALAMRFGLAVGAEIETRTKFDRKNYFYPDLPKGYQISQYDRPITKGGGIRLSSGKTIGIVRAHLEEDAGKAFHEGTPYSLVDLNRCGIPLLEIVSEPDLRSPEEAYEYLTELKLLLRHLMVSDCDMEKGSLRCDVNVSVRRRGDPKFGVRAEIKNLNSFKAVERAIAAEALRHVAVLEAKGTIEPETRLWDDTANQTRLMRKKEASQDYRYFPDPDLPPHRIDQAWIDRVKASMPELPKARLARYQEAFGLSAYDAGVLVQDRDVAAYFEEVAGITGDPKAAANWITADLFGLMNARNHAIADTAIPATALAKLIDLVKSDALNVPSGRKVLEAMYGTGESPDVLVSELGLAQVSDKDALVALVRQAIAANPKAVADLKAGKGKAAGAIVGFVMRESKGRANPGVVNGILDEILPTL